MAAPPEDWTRLTRDTQQNRHLTLLLLLLITFAWLLYAGFVLSTSRQIRLRSAGERSRNMADLSADVLDRQCNSALAVLRVLTQKQALRSAMRARDRTTVRQHLANAVELVPDLLFVAAYRPDGSLLAMSRGRTVGAAEGLAPRRFRAAGASAQPYISKMVRLPNASRTLVLSLAVPLGTGRSSAGYLLAYYHLREIDNWTRSLRFGDEARLFIVDGGGDVVAASDSKTDVNFVGYPPIGRAKSRKAGFWEGAGPDGGERVVVGYSFAEVPQWSVLVIQPIAAAIAPTRFFLLRLASLLLLTSVVILGATVALARLYRRQEEMAHVLTDQNEQLRALDQMKSDFLANVSHDLRTPLASLQVSLSGLLDPSVPFDSHQVRECLQLANEEMEQLNTRVRNLLEMARIEAKAFPMRRDPCDLTDIVGAVLERLEPETRNREVQVDFPREALMVDCDLMQIETVVLNLLENALKYSPPDTPLSLRGEHRHGSVLFSVRDRGAGIAPGEEERIFEKFYRSKRHQSIGGTGLGLAICKAIIVAHGGAIAARSVPGGGAEFSFSLPALSAVSPLEERVHERR